MKIKACIPTVLAALSLFYPSGQCRSRFHRPAPEQMIDSGTDEDGKEF